LPFSLVKSFTVSLLAAWFWEVTVALSMMVAVACGSCCFEGLLLLLMMFPAFSASLYLRGEAPFSPAVAASVKVMNPAMTRGM
jgi:hypothetical protein